MDPILPTSVYDLPPLETGGSRSREGLVFQDHVAAGFCCDMLLEPTLQEVWCEDQDDVTLIWNINGGLRVEFVQIKSDELWQLWSIAVLCDREGKGLGHSILEKSLAYDRCEEPVSFRISTARPVNQDLEILKYPIESLHRINATEALISLKADVAAKVGDFKSQNGNDSNFWVDHATWQVLHSEQAVRNSNRLVLARLFEELGMFLAEDQRDELYDRLIAKVAGAARADHRIDPRLKRITRTDLLGWVTNTATQILHPASFGTGKAAQDKMEAARIPKDTISIAQEERRYYRQEVLKPQYLKLKDRELVEREVLATLQRLKSQLDAGGISDSGIEFHNRCLSNLKDLRDSLDIDPKPPLMILDGYMYNVVDRCLHRFRKAEA